MVTVEATLESDQLKLLGRSVAPVDIAVADAVSMGLRIFVDEIDVVPHVASVLTRAADQLPKAGKGPIRICCLNAPGLPGEVDVALAREFPVTPEIKGAIKSLGGVLDVEEL